MTYTFVPKQKFAKSSGRDVRISAKAATVVCRTIRKKPLTRAKRLLNNLLEQRQSLDGKYYTKAARQILSLLESCEKNAEFLGMDADRLFVHASATHGTIFRRRRRKAAFGSRIKSTNVEIMLIERGKESKHKVSKAKLHAAKHETKESDGAKKELEQAMKDAKDKTKELEEKVKRP